MVSGLRGFLSYQKLTTNSFCLLMFNCRLFSLHHNIESFASPLARLHCWCILWRRSRQRTSLDSKSWCCTGNPMCSVLTEWFLEVSHCHSPLHHTWLRSMIQSNHKHCVLTPLGRPGNLSEKIINVLFDVGEFSNKLQKPVYFVIDIYLRCSYTLFWW